MAGLRQPADPCNTVTRRPTWPGMAARARRHARTRQGTSWRRPSTSSAGTRRSSAPARAAARPGQMRQHTRVIKGDGVTILFAAAIVD